MSRLFLKTLIGMFPTVGYHVMYRRRQSKGLRSPVSAYNTHKEAARKLVHEKLDEWNRHYHLTYNSVSIRNQRSRWGSCSKKKNLNFHYRILELPAHLQDYIVVHELCHLERFDHSKAFWDLVEETIPDYVLRRKELSRFAKQHIVGV